MNTMVVVQREFFKLTGIHRADPWFSSAVTSLKTFELVYGALDLPLQRSRATVELL
jgi:hypothetical protein